MILTGLTEQPWENYKVTKQRVMDTITAALGPSEEDKSSSHASMVDISSCSQVGSPRPNYDRPISVTFQKKEDRELLMYNKKHLPTRIFANDEYPIHVKNIRDQPRPIFRMAKGMPEYKDKCKLDGDRLVINGIQYDIEDIGKLPPDLVVYQAAEKVTPSPLPSMENCRSTSISIQAHSESIMKSSIVLNRGSNT